MTRRRPSSVTINNNNMLTGITILITGSSSGIGAATARLAKNYGANVILHGKTDSIELKKISEELESDYVIFDITDETAVKNGIEKIAEIDVLINNAGINPSKKFEELESNDWQEIFNTNFISVVNVTKAVLPQMKKKLGGKIINISSIKGLPYISAKPAYASAKAAVIRLTSSMAEEFAPYNILINSVAPGFTDTEMTKITQEQIDSIPLQRLAQPNEIAECILFLASKKSSYITGQTIIVDGGYSISR